MDSTTTNSDRQETITLPARKRGRQSVTAEHEYLLALETFAKRIRQIKSTLDFTPSARGWCYILEEFGLRKDGFDQAQNVINECRKRGILPLDITCKDSGRKFYHVEEVDEEDPAEYATESLWWAYSCARRYHPFSFWDDQDYYVQMIVEKIDLRELFSPVCKKFRVPIANARGWSDLHVRAEMMERFRDWELAGKQCVLLYCGDFDPAGELISDNLMNNMRELEVAVGWDPSDVIVDRFGLNRDFIEDNGLSWVNNLMTGGGKDLSDPRHKQHNQPHVQRWLKEVGVRKVEANALVTRPKAGRLLCLDAITTYVDPDAPKSYLDRIKREQDAVRAELDRMVPDAPWSEGGGAHE